MKERRLPLWLLRDIPAFAGVMATLWTFSVFAYLLMRAVENGRRFTATRFNTLTALLAAAETRLDYAIMRQAYRLIGWNPRHVTLLVYTPATTHAECSQRWLAYLHAATHLNATAHAAAAELRRRYAISRAEAQAAQAHGSTHTQRRAARRAPVGVPRSQDAQIALMVSSTRSVRQSNHEGVLPNARGPPNDCLLPIAHCLSAPATENEPARLQPSALTIAFTSVSLRFSKSGSCA